MAGRNTPRPQPRFGWVGSGIQLWSKLRYDGQLMCAPVASPASKDLDGKAICVGGGTPPSLLAVDARAGIATPPECQTAIRTYAPLPATLVRWPSTATDPSSRSAWIPDPIRRDSSCE